MDRNPSPPPSALNTLDESSSVETNRIGDTVFSKLWVVTLLEKMLKAASEQFSSTLNDISSEDSKVVSTACCPTSEDKTCTTESGLLLNNASMTEVSQCSGGGDESPHSLDGDLEEELCLLWDATANTEVALFLCKQDAVRLLLEVADVTSSQRFKEICIGITGNLACISTVCKNELCDLDTLKMLLCFLASSDTTVLTQTTRCLSLCFAHKEAQVVEQHQNLVDLLLGCLTFILKSSTNDELLKYTSCLLNELLEGSETLQNKWALEIDLVDAICEAIEQTCSSSRETTDTLVMTLHLMTTRPEGVQSTVSLKQKVWHACVSCMCCLDYLDSTHYTMIQAAASTYLCVYEAAKEALTSETDSSEVIINESDRETLLNLISHKMDDTSDSLQEMKQSIKKILDCSTL